MEVVGALPLFRMAALSHPPPWALPTLQHLCATPQQGYSVVQGLAWQAEGVEEEVWLLLQVAATLSIRLPLAARLTQSSSLLQSCARP